MILNNLIFTSLHVVAIRNGTQENSKKSLLSPYALTKYIGEEMVLNYAKINNFHAISLRLFNVYGFDEKSLNNSGVIRLFINNKKNNIPLKIFGSGRQVRDFVHVKDVSKAFLLAGLLGDFDNVFNVGSGLGISITNLANLISREISFFPGRENDIFYSVANINKIEKVLKWKRKYDLKQSLENYIN